MIDFKMIAAVSDAYFLADIAIRHRVKVPVFAQKYMIVLLYFCFCVMLNRIRGIR
jgi:hypothetical protein